MTRLAADLARLAGQDALREGGEYIHDSTEMQGLAGQAEAVVAPPYVAAMQAVVAWCYERGISMVPRGGVTGFAGGAVHQGVVGVSLVRPDRRRYQALESLR